LLTVNITVDDTGPAALSAMEQLPKPPGETLVGVQTSAVSEPENQRVTGHDCELPLSVTVMLAA
jgi:hypothetical protein